MGTARASTALIVVASAILVLPRIAVDAKAQPRDDSGGAESAIEDRTEFISGSWYFSGGYDDPARRDEAVDFSAYFLSDGTFVDRDNYRGRWIAAGDSFSMYYLDASQLVYVGTIDGARVAGRFRGRDVSGHFQMTRGP